MAGQIQNRDTRPVDARERMSKTLFVGLCVLAGLLPLGVTSQLLNGIELTKLLAYFAGTGVLVSLRVWKSG